MDINYQQRQVMAGSSWQRRNASELARYEDMGHEVAAGRLWCHDRHGPPTPAAVLGYVSLPDYDLSIFEGGSVDSGAWAQILADDNNPLFDRVISAKDAPGSTFKLCTALAGLASGNLGKTERISATGAISPRPIPPTPPSAGPPTPRTIRTRRSSKAFPTPATTSSTRSASAPACRRSTSGAAALGLTSRTNIELPGESTSFVGNQDALYDPDVAIEDQMTTKPMVVGHRPAQPHRRHRRGAQHRI